MNFLKRHLQSFKKAIDEAPVGPDVSWITNRLAADKRFVVVDIGAQTLAAEQHIYAPLLESGLSSAVIGFEPLEERVRERALADGQSSTIYPYAIGDGQTRTLYINNDDATSSLFPLDQAFCADFEHLNTLRPTSTLEVKTSKLDDALTDWDKIDFLKLDIQGAELMAMQNAEQTLKRTSVIHCEVEFSAIYENQPLFHDIQRFLIDRGFDLIDLFISYRYAYENEQNIVGRDRLIWADALFFKNSHDKDVLISQAAISAIIYNKMSLAASLCDRYDRLKV